MKTLYEKGIEGHACYFKEDVKQFIKDLKEQLGYTRTYDDILETIDKLSGFTNCVEKVK